MIQRYDDSLDHRELKNDVQVNIEKSDNTESPRTSDTAAHLSRSRNENLCSF